MSSTSTIHFVLLAIAAFTAPFALRADDPVTFSCTPHVPPFGWPTPDANETSFYLGPSYLYPVIAVYEVVSDENELCRLVSISKSPKERDKGGYSSGLWIPFENYYLKKYISRQYAKPFNSVQDNTTELEWRFEDPLIEFTPPSHIIKLWKDVVGHRNMRVIW